MALAAGCVAAVWLYRVWPSEPAVDASVVARPKIDGQRALVVGNRTRGPRPLVIMLHGVGGNRRMLMNDRIRSFTQTLVDGGYLLAASDGHGTAWGARPAQQDYRRLYRWVADHHRVGRVVLVSVSMGGITGLNLVADDAIPRLAGWIGVSPVTDLQWASQDAHLSESVAAALGPGAVRRLDPMRMSPRRFAGKRLVIFTAGGDTVVPEVYARRFAEHVAPSTRVRFERCVGVHAGQDCFSPAAVEALLD
jgi:pimeloyl-ACP methyl ester carboxylesterase